jgi:hypothetical protein
MKIAQFQNVTMPHLAPRVFAEGDVSTTLSMYARISEWVEVEFPQLPEQDYVPRQIQALAQEEQDLREKLEKVTAARASLQTVQP